MSGKSVATRVAVLLLLACALPGALAAPPSRARSVLSDSLPASSTGTLGNRAAPGGEVARGRVLDRARAWADHGVPYSANGLKPPYSWWEDAATGGRYRQDCSGLVSMAWQLPRSLTTRDLPGVATEIDPADLRPGDVLNSPEHVVLFAYWIDPAAGTFAYYQESGREHLTALYTDGDLGAPTLTGHPTGEYRALRYRNIVEDAAAVPPPAR
ncbi:hypothetical protein [Kitasatospora sp. NPDC050543]|uniref:hypothetical protein n=1 Tax=Kitasatospora sp. NPDC050543 TaxID=3364054 RepID=UPI00378FBCE8